MVRLFAPFIIFLGISAQSLGNRLLIPMDDSQKNHLKAYGIAYWILKSYEMEMDWLLNYRGGSFMVAYNQQFASEMTVRGVSFEVISEGQAGKILSDISAPDVNMDAVKLQKAPKVAVYSPKSKSPWDDAVTLVLTYAEIPYDVVYDDEVLNDKLPEYDWLHLHHEDFTGQFGKFFQYKDYPWYREQKREAEGVAEKFQFANVPQMKLAVAKKISAFVTGGGYMFAMCNATDTFDIALAADGLDIVEAMYDGTPADPTANSKLHYENTFAFQNFKTIPYPYEIEFSDIDSQVEERGLNESNDFFSLFQFSAKWDPVPSMLTQNHQTIIKGFCGQTTAFKNRFVKPEVVVLAENKQLQEARYIHSTHGKGFFTFYGGHDPEDYQHRVGEEPTDLNLHPNSAGYRLILNNILFPAAKKKKMKT
ncbi:asparagine synthetase B [Dyadobacter subterraneus]|uniref:Asparagine synthetase B n=1 Tax=Dyadobacter subterraneus TaxID=2773304 RepID=A0ABR9WGS6_9BACT|nr:asparagine synthetase B [Dyadobacter subterraneus]MBE9464699.1 asparagine synthetase B [Dyadobacter subterraneus]